MSKVFFLHTHYVPPNIQNDSIFAGAVIVPEFYPNLNYTYYDDVVAFRGLEQYFDYIEKTEKKANYYAIENINMILPSTDIALLKKNNVKILQLYHHNGSRYFTIENGLTDEGYKLLKLMAKNDMILDLSHLPEKYIDDTLNSFDGKIIVSHCACSELYKYDKSRSNSLSKSAIELLQKRDTLFGIAFINDIISNTPCTKNENDETLLEDLFKQVLFFVDIVGDNNVALGPDFIDLQYFSNVFGIELKISRYLYSSIGYEMLKERLVLKGYENESIERIFSRNAIDFLG